MINTNGKKSTCLGKRKHTMLYMIKSDRKVISLKRPQFSLYHCVFFAAVAQILVGRLDSCFVTHIKKYMTSIHASTFEKYVKVCVYIRHIKKPV